MGSEGGRKFLFRFFAARLGCKYQNDKKRANIIPPTLQIACPIHVGQDKCNVGDRFTNVGRSFFSVGRHFFDVGAVLFGVGRQFFIAGNHYSNVGQLFLHYGEAKGVFFKTKDLQGFSKP